MKASLTLESSLIYPIIIVITFMLIIYGFNMHDRLSAKATAYTYLLQEYHKDDSDTSPKTLPQAIESACLLSANISVASYSFQDVSLQHHTGNISVSLSNDERCQYIRRINAAIKLLE